jgi:hypothetical protein
MPYIIRPRRVRSVVLAILGATALFGAMPALASAACPTPGSSQLLAEQGDNASYFLLEGSSFEEGAPGWSLINAEVVSEGNEGIGGETGHGVLIHPGGELVSPAFCVSSNIPSFRCYAKQQSSGWFGGALNVSLRFRDGFGFTHTVPLSFGLLGNGSWALSPVLELAKKLPWWAPDNVSVNLVFQPANGSSWVVDEVLIDPYAR